MKTLKYSMNEIKIWNYDNLEIRTIEKGGESWCVLSDVCKCKIISPLGNS